LLIGFYWDLNGKITGDESLVIFDLNGLQRPSHVKIINEQMRFDGILMGFHGISIQCYLCLFDGILMDFNGILLVFYWGFNGILIGY
jgi:hypothetical protein